MEPKRSVYTVKELENARSRPFSDDPISSAFKRPNYNDSVIQKFTFKHKKDRTIGPKAVLHSNEPLYLYHGERPCVSSTTDDATSSGCIFNQLFSKPTCNCEPESVRLLRRNMIGKTGGFSRTNAPEKCPSLFVPKLHEIKNYECDEDVLMLALRNKMGILGRNDVPLGKRLGVKSNNLNKKNGTD